MLNTTTTATRHHTLYQRYLTSTIINPTHHESCLLDQRLEFQRRPFNAVNDAHHCDIALMAVPREVAVVGRQRRRCGPYSLAAHRCVHDLVAYHDSGVLTHTAADCLENADAVIVGPVMAVWGQLLGIVMV